VTARSQARDDAVAVLLDAGWPAGRIRQALGIPEELAARLVRQARPVQAAGACGRKLGFGLWCDAPVRWPGSVYCDTHHPTGWRLQA
jgi:hypothetical protein